MTGKEVAYQRKQRSQPVKREVFQPNLERLKHVYIKNIRSAEQDDFVKKHGLKKFVDLPWEAAGCPDGDVIRAITSWNKDTELLDYRGHDISISKAAVLRAFKLKDGGSCIQKRWKNYTSQNFNQQDRNANGYQAVGCHRQILRQRIEWITTALQVKRMRAEYPTFIVKLVDEDDVTDKAWGDFLYESLLLALKRAQEAIVNQSPIPLELGSHMRILIHDQQPWKTADTEEASTERAVRAVAEMERREAQVNEQQRRQPAQFPDETHDMDIEERVEESSPGARERGRRLHKQGTPVQKTATTNPEVCQAITLLATTESPAPTEAKTLETIHLRLDGLRGKGQLTERDVTEEPTETEKLRREEEGQESTGKVLPSSKLGKEFNLVMNQLKTSFINIHNHYSRDKDEALEELKRRDPSDAHRVRYCEEHHGGDYEWVKKVSDERTKYIKEQERKIEKWKAGYYSSKGQSSEELAWVGEKREMEKRINEIEEVWRERSEGQANVWEAEKAALTERIALQKMKEREAVDALVRFADERDCETKAHQYNRDCSAVPYMLGLLEDTWKTKEDEVDAARQHLLRVQGDARILRLTNTNLSQELTVLNRTLAEEMGTGRQLVETVDRCQAEISKAEEKLKQIPVKRSQVDKAVLTDREETKPDGATTETEVERRALQGEIGRTRDLLEFKESELTRLQELRSKERRDYTCDVQMREERNKVLAKQLEGIVAAVNSEREKGLGFQKTTEARTEELKSAIINVQERVTAMEEAMRQELKEKEDEIDMGKRMLAAMEEDIRKMTEEYEAAMNTEKGKAAAVQQYVRKKTEGFEAAIYTEKQKVAAVEEEVKRNKEEFKAAEDRERQRAAITEAEMKGKLEDLEAACDKEKQKVIAAEETLRCWREEWEAEREKGKQKVAALHEEFRLKIGKERKEWDDDMTNLEEELEANRYSLAKANETWNVMRRMFSTEAPAPETQRKKRQRTEDGYGTDPKASNGEK